MSKSKVDYLITINQGVRGDRTLREFDQYLRVDLMDDQPPLPKTQILFDRRHIQNPRLSKPVAYITFSSPGDVFRLAAEVFAAGMAMTLSTRKDASLREMVKSALDFQFNDVVIKTEAYLGELRRRRAQVKLESHQSSLSEEAP